VVSLRGRAVIHNRLAGLFFARNVPHFLTEVLAARFGIAGFHLTVGAASAASAVALGQAANLLRAGKVDVVLAGGAETLPITNVIGLQTLGVCAEGKGSPFSGEPGISFGEGAAFLVLESLEHARARGAPILAEILGFGVTSDAYDVISNDPSGDGLFRSMAAALSDAGVARGEIDWIRASGTGNRDQDLAETLAIQRLYAGGTPPPTSSLDSFFGHVNGVSPALGLAGAVAAQNAGFIPPTASFTTSRPGCGLDYVPNEARPAEIRHFLSNSAAFGGVNAVLVGGRFHPSRPQRDPALDEVVITGMGVVSPIGHGLEAFRAALSRGESGIGELDRFSTGDLGCRRAGLVRELQPRRLTPTLDLRRADRIAQFAAVAAGLALRDAGLEGGALPAERKGVVMGMAHGPVASHEVFFRTLFAGPATPALGKLMLEMGRFAVTSRVSHLHQLRGYGTTLTGGIGSGLHALIHAFEHLRQNDSVDAVVVVAADEIGALYFQLFDRMGALSTNGFAPYHADAGGMVLGEGAAALVIERASSARARGGRVYARLAGAGLAADALGFLRSEPEGRALERAARLAMEEAEVEAGGLDVVYGHGRGVPTYDAREARALGRVLEGRRVPVCCVMGNTGVAEAASGLFSVVAATLGLQHGEAYPLAGGPPATDGLAFVGDGVLQGPYRRALVAGGTESGNDAALVLERAPA
jgi:3-oxoacyl-[acyl-carrier-protein] synthase II